MAGAASRLEAAEVVPALDRRPLLPMAPLWRHDGAASTLSAGGRTLTETALVELEIETDPEKQAATGHIHFLAAVVFGVGLKVFIFGT